MEQHYPNTTLQNTSARGKQSALCFPLGLYERLSAQECID